MDQIIQNLSFEAVAVPHDVVPTTTAYTTPIKVKIKMKKGDNNGIPRQGFISVPKMRPTYPAVTRTVRSDETIMSFNIHVDPEPESKPRRKSQKFFHLFKTGICLDTQGNDENDPPYLLATAVKSKEIKSERLILEAPGKKGKADLSKGNSRIKTSKNVSKPSNIIFGKCKPGGCLDPPFSEDNYQYHPFFQSKQELKENEIKPLEKLCIENPDKDKGMIEHSESAVKNSDFNKSDRSSTFMLYRVSSKNKVLNDKYSDSIITYPTRTSSRDLSILEKTAMSRKSSSIPNRQLNVDSYFTPSKIRKSQENKMESVNKVVGDSKSGEKEKIKSNRPSYNIPGSDYEQVTTLLQDGNNSIVEDYIQTNQQELLTQSNNKISQLIEVSGNIILTVSQIKEPLDSSECKLDIIKMESEVEVKKDSTEHYKNVSENAISKKIDGKDDEVSILNILNNYSREVFDESQKLDETNSNPTLVRTGPEFNKNSGECDLAHYEISNYSQLEEKVSLVQFNGSSTKIFIEEEHRKQIKAISDNNEPVTNDRHRSSNLCDTHKNITKELPKHCSYSTEESILEISLYGVKPQLLDLNLTTKKLTDIDKSEDNNFVMKIKRSNEQIDEYFANISDSLDVDKINNKNLGIHNDLDMNSSNIEFHERNTTEYSYYGKDNSTEKKRLTDNFTTGELKAIYNDNIMKENIILDVDTEVQILKEATSLTKLDTYIDRESMSKNQSHSKSVQYFIPFSAINPSSNLSSVKDFALSFADSPIRNKSDEIFLQKSNSPIVTQISEKDIVTKLGQNIENENLLEHENIPPRTVESFREEDRLPAIFSDKYAVPEINSNNDFVLNIDTVVINEGVENDITDIQRKYMQKENTVISEAILDESPPINLDTRHTEYSSLDTSLTTISLQNKRSGSKDYKNGSEPTKDSETYQTVTKDMNDDNVSLKRKMNENDVLDSKIQTLKVTENYMQNKLNLIETTKYLEINNNLSLPDYTLKDQLTVRSDTLPLTLSFNKPKLFANQTHQSVNTGTHSDVHLLTNLNSASIEKLYEIDQTSDIKFHNEPFKTAKNTKIETKGIEWESRNYIKKKNTRGSVKSFTNEFITVDIGLQTYINKKGETILKTFDTSQEPLRYSQDKIFFKRSSLRLNDSKLTFAINSETRLSIQFDKTTNKNYEKSYKQEGNTLGGTTQNITHRHGKVLSNVSDIGMLQESLSAIYENDLIPIEKLIKSLRLEIDRIAKYRYLMKKKSNLAFKKLKPTYSKKCVCIRNWNITD